MVSEKELKNLKKFSSTYQPTGKRKKRGPYLVPLLRKFLNKKINYEDPETQKMIRGKVKDAIMWRLILNAAQGENHAIKEILDRVDGKVADILVDQSENHIHLTLEKREEKLANIRDAVKKGLI